MKELKYAIKFSKKVLILRNENEQYVSLSTFDIENELNYANIVECFYQTDANDETNIKLFVVDTIFKTINELITNVNRI